MRTAEIEILAATPATPSVDTDERVTVVLPCLNEEGSVGLCVQEALDTMRAAGIDGEVLVVDNGSTDRSVEVARAAGARVISELVPGYGRALRAGIRAAGGSIVVMADADWTYDRRRLPELIAPVLRDEADLVIGSRLEAATVQTMPWMHKYIGTPVLSYLMRRAAGGISLRDGSSGYRAFRRDRVLELGLRGVAFEFMAEMHVRAGQAGMRFYEFPAGYRQRIGESKLSTFGAGWSNLKVILLLAPDLLLVGPGAVLFSIGLLVTLLSFLSPAGVPIGSVRWQPIFFSSIALVLGLQAVMIGLVATHRSWLLGRQGHRPFPFVSRPGFLRACALTSVGAVILGLGIDVALTVYWLLGQPTPRLALQLASVAQNLLVLGGLLLSFVFVLRSLTWRDVR